MAKCGGDVLDYTKWRASPAGTEHGNYDTWLRARNIRLSALVFAKMNGGSAPDSIWLDDDGTTWLTYDRPNTSRMFDVVLESDHKIVVVP